MLSDEEKQAIEELKNKKADYFMISNLTSKTLLNLIEKQSKEIEELKQNIHLKEVYVLKTNDYIKGTNVEDELCNKKWKDKIKAEIEEHEKQIEKMEKDDIGRGFTLGKEWSDLKAKIEFGQSLLEKEYKNEM